MKYQQEEPFRQRQQQVKGPALKMHPRCSRSVLLEWRFWFKGREEEVRRQAGHSRVTVEEQRRGRGAAVRPPHSQTDIK